MIKRCERVVCRTSGTSMCRLVSMLVWNDGVLMHGNSAAVHCGLGLCLVASVLSPSCVSKLPAKRDARGRTLTVCELSRDFAAYADQTISVRGVYYYGLRQDCPQKCATGEPWPSALELADSGYHWSGERVPFATDQHSWDALDALLLEKARSGEKIELWVTVLGHLKVHRGSPLGPCDWVANGISDGLQVRGRSGAVLIVKRFSAAEVRYNPQTPYDYTVFRQKRKE
jgi:hypothetical protein